MEQLFKFVKNSDMELSEYHSNWATYISEDEKSSSQITVDLNLINHAPISKLDNIVFVSIKTPNPTDDGIPIDKDEIILYNIENQILDNLNLRGVDFSFAGMLTSDNVRDFYFYGNSIAIIKKTINAIMKKFPEFEFSFGYRMDKDWNVYIDFIYPLPNQLQEINNKRIIEKLIKNGDQIEKEREICHWVFFKDFDELEQFEEYTLSNNFKTLKKGSSNSVGEYPWLIKVSIKEAATIDAINTTTTSLLNKALSLNGDYDGWETYTR